MNIKQLTDTQLITRLNDLVEQYLGTAYHEYESVYIETEMDSLYEESFQRGLMKQ